MESTDYLIVGSSHAALEAVGAIRAFDATAGIALLTRDRHLPYSPTILPYVVSGRSAPERVILRHDADLAALGVDFRRDAAVAAVRPKEKRVDLHAGASWRYGKLLLATGARPALPPVKGLGETPHHVLRTLDDALSLRQAIGQARRAVVLGAGLIGMHAAENLAQAGIAVTVVERRERVLAEYFDDAQAALIAAAFTAHGVTIRTGTTATQAEVSGATTTLVLDDGSRIDADLLLVATGVAPAIDYLADSGIATDRGILVDEAMRTSVADVWAAGDVAQGPSFYGDRAVVNGTLPQAVEQGRAAGMAMSGDPAFKPYPGGVPLNTYSFFGQFAVAVGIGGGAAIPEGAEVTESGDAATGSLMRIVLGDDRLLGISAVNRPLDGGVMWQLIVRRVDLGPAKAAFLADPLGAGRVLMSRLWR